jgi:putative aldouronate transport system substrate-binding protein
VGYGDWYRNLQKNVPGAEFVPVQTFRNKDGRYKKITYPPVGLYIFSPKTAKNTDAVIKYLDWHAQEDVGWTMSFGIEGEHYEMKDGAPLPIDPGYNSKTWGYIIGDLRLLFNGPYPIGTEAEDKILVISQGDLGEFALASKKMAESDGFPEIVFNEEIAAWSKYGPEISKAYDEYWVKMVTASDFEATFAEFMREIKARNIEEVAAEREAYYKKYF